jgi:hypothetical protein
MPTTTCNVSSLNSVRTAEKLLQKVFQCFLSLPSCHEIQAFCSIIKSILCFLDIHHKHHKHRQPNLRKASNPPPHCGVHLLSIEWFFPLIHGLHGSTFPPSHAYYSPKHDLQSLTRGAASTITCSSFVKCRICAASTTRISCG